MVVCGCGAAVRNCVAAGAVQSSIEFKASYALLCADDRPDVSTFDDIVVPT